MKFLHIRLCTLSLSLPISLNSPYETNFLVSRTYFVTEFHFSRLFPPSYPICFCTIFLDSYLLFLPYWVVAWKQQISSVYFSARPWCVLFLENLQSHSLVLFVYYTVQFFPSGPNGWNPAKFVLLNSKAWILLNFWEKTYSISKKKKKNLHLIWRKRTVPPFSAF